MLVIDNINTHHSLYIKKLCAKARVRIEYIPPYSPNLSLIEESFSALKAWMRRNRKLGQELLPFYELFLYLAVAQCNFKLTARNLFRACGIDVTDDNEDINYNTLSVPIIEVS